MVFQSLVIGYHGRDIRVARKIISLQDQLKPSQNAWGWLGHGIYFWEDSHRRAERWAREESQRPRSPIKTPAVVGAILDLGNCLHLADAEALMQVRVAHDAYQQICTDNGATVARNRGVELRARYLANSEMQRQRSRP